MSDDSSNSSPPPRPPRGSVVIAGLLLLALAVVVIYTSRQAFSSPLALVVVAAIGLAALLFQLRLRSNSDDKSAPANIHASLWLNALGLAFAVSAVSADYFHLSSGLMAVSALGALVCFGVSGARVLHALRKK